LHFQSLFKIIPKMLFIEPTFLFIFLPVVLFTGVILRPGAANIFLLAASFVFYYIGEKQFVIALFSCAVINYIVGLAIGRSRGRKSASWYLAGGIVFNLGLLVYFKYSVFFIDNLRSMGVVSETGAAGIDIHMPLGISFFTFQAISYIVDIANRRAESKSGITAASLYITLFPQLIAGPIVRYRDLASQILSRRISVEGFSYGAFRFVMGMGKKKIIADPLGGCADKIFGIPPEHLTTPLAWLGISCYTLQIYFDFSGYSDMAIGIGRMLGFRFPENFNYPYISRSLREFWRRWHITLSSWFRDYVYVPLGGNKNSTFRTYLNLIVVFALCGLWHGAEWKFLAWGLCHGAFLILERTKAFRFLESRAWRLGHLYTLVVVMSGWALFRADTFSYAISFLGAMFGFADGDGIVFNAGLYLNNEIILLSIAGWLGAFGVAPMVASLIKKAGAGLFGKEIIAFHYGIAVAKLAVIVLVFIASAMRIASGTYSPFLYFRF